MDLKDRALLLNPDDVAALLEGLELEHESHGIGNMRFCDRAVCRLAAGLNSSDLKADYDELRDRYDTGWDDGYAEGFEAGKRAAARA